MKARVKARVKATGEEITILGISNEWGLVQYIDSNRVLRARAFEDKEIEIISTDNEGPINWDQRRYEILKDVLAAQITDTEFAENNPAQTLAKLAVRYVDALIEELKGARNESHHE